MWLYPLFTRIEKEVSVDPHSAFWIYHQEVDYDDPLALMIRCEDGDEEAMELMRPHRAPRGF